MNRSSINVYTMRIDRLDEAAIASWLDVLDENERARAARFVFSRHRVQYVAAHALVRAVLSVFVPGALPEAWHFRGAEHTKPVAWLGNAPASVSFNLSHTEGLVGVAAIALPGWALGFDVEALDRSVTLDVATHYFRPEEIAWLYAQPSQDRSIGFLRLWTLKEAFIKATGQGLSQDLASFWFTPDAPRIHFTPALLENTEDWRFEQRLVSGDFIAAVGVRRPDNARDDWGSAVWTEVNPAKFNDFSIRLSDRVKTSLSGNAGEASRQRCPTRSW